MNPTIERFFFQKEEPNRKIRDPEECDDIFFSEPPASSSSVSDFLPFPLKVSKRDSPSKEVESIYPEIGATFHMVKGTNIQKYMEYKMSFPKLQKSMVWICFHIQFIIQTCSVYKKLIAFANSKGDSPIYDICIFTSYYFYIIIYIINKHVYPTPRPTQKRQTGSARSIYWTYPFTGRIFSAAGSIHWRYNSWAKEAGVKETRGFIQDAAARIKNGKRCLEPWCLACQKTWKKWKMERLNYYIKLGGFKYVSLNVQPVVPWGNDPI